MFERYAIFHTPAGALAEWGEHWLGWSSARGCRMPHADFNGLDVGKITAKPRKYGVHGTLKAPFHLRDDLDVDQLKQAAADFASRTAAFNIGDVKLRFQNGFVALRPVTRTEPLHRFATSVVKDFDSFRAQLSDADIARRRRSSLNNRQDKQMLEWGYPYIFDDFHFHITLSGSVASATATKIITALTPVLNPLVETPFLIDTITLMGQDSDGMFHQIHRYMLTG